MIGIENWAHFNIKHLKSFQRRLKVSIDVRSESKSIVLTLTSSMNDEGHKLAEDKSTIKTTKQCSKLCIKK